MSDTSVELWASVVGFPNTEVSSLGRVRSLFRGQCRIRPPQPHQHGYVTVSLQNKTVKKRARIHVLVAEAFIGPKLEGMDVNHRDGVKTNNRVDNLEYMTRSENCKHGFRIGLSYTPFKKRGEEHIRSVLRDADVRTIRQEHANGISRRALATRFGISYYTVWDITKRRSWTHI
jgi:hypothetical protein